MPITLTIAIGDFDFALLPEGRRHDKHAPSFDEAVRDYFERRLATLGTVTVARYSESFVITLEPRSGVTDLNEEALSLLEAGRLSEAVPILEAIVAADRNDVGALVNLGMALSDLKQFQEAIRHLLRAAEVDPTNATIETALGVAYHRANDSTGAIEALRRALALDDTNGYAHRNLGAVLSGRGNLESAEHHLRRAVELIPNDAAALYELGDVLLRYDAEQQAQEADQFLSRAITLAGATPIRELAEKARSRLAARTFRKRGGNVRSDATMYCLGALERFEKLSRQQVEGILFEIAILGTRGLDVNDPERKYTLKALRGAYSGLHLVSMMYVAAAQIYPEMDVGFDLSREYMAAKQKHDSQKKGGSHR